MRTSQGWLIAAGLAMTAALAGCGGDEGGTSAQGGSGGSPLCTPGARQCEGNVPRVCDSTGAAWQSGSECPFLCSEGACIGACKPGASECDGRTPRTCSAQGQWEAQATCQYLCSSGACTGECVPGEKKCDGLTPQSCDQAGKWVAGAPCETACAEGACGACVPGAKQCNGLVPQSCDAAGVWRSEQICPFLCKDGACSGECEPGAKQCVGLVPRQCDPDGMWVVQAACEHVCESGSCTGECSPGTKQCNGLVPELCGPDGQWKPQEVCPLACADGSCFTPDAGADGSAGSGGSGGSAGSGGASGSGGSAGDGGSAGAGGTSGTGGSAGASGAGGNAGSGGTAGTGGSSGTGGTAGSGTAPEIVTAGANNKYLLRGTVVSPETASQGEVLVESNVITCVAASCSNEPGASGATVIDTHGMIFPGMIDAHNHILYNVFDEADWTPSKLYSNHNQWPQEASYQAMQDCYDYLINSTSVGGMNLDCEVLKYGELKGMIAGTTSILGEPKGSAQTCYSSLVRSIDGQFNDLPATARPAPCTDPASSDHIQVAALGIGTVDEVGAKANFGSCKTWSYVVHVAEGVPGDTASTSEWTQTLTKGLDVQQLSIIHGTALGTTEFQHMADKGMKLIWSPKSNMFLYGKTTAINLARAVSPHLTIALAPDWSMGGSVNLIDELNYAWGLTEQQWPGVLQPKDLVKMVTSEAARALEVQDQLGTIEVGKLADLVVVSGDSADPWKTLVTARPGNMRMVMVNGAVVYGDGSLSAAASLPECETIEVCGSSRFMCVKEQVTTSKLNQTYAEILGALSGALQSYDTAHGTHYAPIAPLVKCP